MTAPRLSSDFWKINIGHVLSIAVFVFGLGVSWQAVQSEIKAVSVSEQNHYYDATKALEAAKKERALQFQSLTERVEKTERFQSAIEAMTATLVELKTQVGFMQQSNTELHRDIKDHIRINK